MNSNGSALSQAGDALARSEAGWVLSFGVAAGDVHRFALAAGGEWRALRWLARVLAVLALWPVWYAWFGKSSFDWDAMLFGGPALLTGLLLWAWTGYRVRHPLDYVEIDRARGLARLQREGATLASCRLAALGAWTVSSHERSYGSGHQRSVMTWHVVRCPGFAGHELFADPDAAACRRWCTQVDALARPFPDGAWRFSAATVDLVLSRHQLHDRSALLWTATGLLDEGEGEGHEGEGEGELELDEATLDAAARQLSETTLGDRLAAGFDALVAAGAGVGGTVVLTVLTGACLFAASQLLARTDDEASAAAVLLAIVLAMLALMWRAQRGPALAAAFAALLGVAFVSKPGYAPVVREFMGEVHVLSLTSETHLYYVIPGVGLLLLALGLLSTIKLRKHGAPPPPAHVDPAKLDPPRPRPGS